MFKSILFRSAICAMACDGQIHPDEIQELSLILKETTYFNDENSLQLEGILNEEIQPRKLMSSYFEMLQSHDFSLVEQLLIFEIVFRIVNSDNIIHENEIVFIKVLMKKLKTPKSLLTDRFGSLVNILGPEYAQEDKIKLKIWLEEIDLPEIKSINPRHLKKG